MKKVLFFIVAIFIASSSFVCASCDYPDDLDSRGRRCGGRAASVRKGGRLGGDNRYVDSYGRDRIYGKNNDPYDEPSYDNTSSNTYDDDNDEENSEDNSDE